MGNSRAMLPAGPDESLSERAYFAIREFILRGELPLGAPLSRRNLAHRLKMSLLPVGEALQRLEREGLVETRQRAGTRVRMPTRQDVEDQYIIREALESQSARLVAQRATVQQFHELRRMAEQVDFLYHRSNSIGDDAEFMFNVHMQHFNLHIRIAEFANCKGLREEIESKQVLMLNWLYMVAAPGRELPRHFHRELVEALASRDPERADREMRHHVHYALPELLRRIEARQVQGWRHRTPLEARERETSRSTREKQDGERVRRIKRA
jgi:GntR family transcriptional regulator, rspAB operon transcriptional repressor